MKTEENIKLKTNLKKLLDEKNISLHQLAVKTSVNKSSLHNYLNGVLPQGLSALVKLSNLFEVSLDELVFQKIKPQKNLSKNNQEESYLVTIKKVEPDL